LFCWYTIALRLNLFCGISPGAKGQESRYDATFNLVTYLKRLGHDPTVTSSPTSPGFPGASIIDGNPERNSQCGCCAVLNTTGSWITVEFQQEYKISRIVVQGMTNITGRPIKIHKMYL